MTKRSFVILALAFLFLPIARSATSYRVNNGASTTITEHSTTRTVTNSSGQDIFIPTATATEWSNFYTNGTPGVTVTACGGTSVGGYCWYLGGYGESCDTVCASRGGYNAATASYAGQAGTNAQCNSVLVALGQASSVIDFSCTSAAGSGCLRHSNGNRVRCTNAVTTSSAANVSYARACACNS